MHSLRAAEIKVGEKIIMKIFDELKQIIYIIDNYVISIVNIIFKRFINPFVMSYCIYNMHLVTSLFSKNKYWDKMQKEKEKWILLFKHLVDRAWTYLIKSLREREREREFKCRDIRAVLSF
jgi:hypothetical protein